VIPSEVTDSIVSALIRNDASALLATADQVLSEGRNVQHFCGELVRYFRNLLVQKVAGEDTRLVSAGPDERKSLGAHSAAFSQEDLTRYVQLLLELYRDLQAAAQPRFRLEVGLLKLLYAGYLQPIEEVLSRLGGAESEGSRKESVRTGSAALSAAKAESVREAIPAEPIPAVAEPHQEQFSGAEPRKEVSSTDGDVRSRVLAALRSDKSDHLADAVEHGTISLEGDNVLIRSPADYRTTLELGVDSLETVVAKVVGSRVHVRLGDDLDETESRQIVSVGSSVTIGSDGTTVDSGAGGAKKRALADPAVQMIQKAFAGQIREVRNLRGYSQ
jgi:DNA polymerase-3 subunit gamma/tau